MALQASAAHFGNHSKSVSVEKTVWVSPLKPGSWNSAGLPKEKDAKVRRKQARATVESLFRELGLDPNAMRATWIKAQNKSEASIRGYILAVGGKRTEDFGQGPGNSWDVEIRDKLVVSTDGRLFFQNEAWGWARGKQLTVDEAKQKFPDIDLSAAVLTAFSRKK